MLRILIFALLVAVPVWGHGGPPNPGGAGNTSALSTTCDGGPLGVLDCTTPECYCIDRTATPDQFWYSAVAGLNGWVPSGGGTYDFSGTGNPNSVGCSGAACVCPLASCDCTYTQGTGGAGVDTIRWRAQDGCNGNPTLWTPMDEVLLGTWNSQNNNLSTGGATDCFSPSHMSSGAGPKDCGGANSFSAMTYDAWLTRMTCSMSYRGGGEHATYGCDFGFQDDGVTLGLVEYGSPNFDAPGESAGITINAKIAKGSLTEVEVFEPDAGRLNCGIGDAGDCACASPGVIHYFQCEVYGVPLQ